MSDQIADPIAALYAGSLHAFVTARKALVKELRAEGDMAGARKVDKLKKPGLPIWCINQLVHHDRPLVDAFLAALDRQRDLQLAALKGGVAPDDLREAKQQEKTALSAIMKRVPAVLDDDGHAATKTTGDKVRATLRAAALAPDKRQLLEQGCLNEGDDSTGFDAVAAQLDPALLMAALQASEKPKKKKAKKVDGFFARSARKEPLKRAPKRERARPKTLSEPPPPSSTRAERAKHAAEERKAEALARKKDKVDRLTRAKATLTETRIEIESNSESLETLVAKVQDLEHDLEEAKAEMRRVKRRQGQLKERLANAEKRVRILED